MTPSADTSPNLFSSDRRFLQSIIRTLLYYGRALDYSILPTLNDVAREQANPTVSTMTKAKRILDYVATHPNAFIRYYTSDMVLHIENDAAYLLAPQAKSRITVFYHLSVAPSATIPPPLNGSVLVECKTLRHVVTSAAEAEVAGLFYNAQTILPIRRILYVLDHSQLPTLLKTDNSTANGFVHINIHQKRSKLWDMRYYWLRDKILQNNFIFLKEWLNQQCRLLHQTSPYKISSTNKIKINT